ncbi:MAG: AMP-binding protein, partial [Euzebyales bacterium]|nr:AMP-binding protein [Euzebyales bacterium]
PLPGVRVRAVDSAGRPVPAGEIGELSVRGGNVTMGYVDDPELTATVLRDGWLATGDLGTVDGDSAVRILDRRKDVILRGGVNVFSVQVEAVLRTAPGVREAAVYGIPDELGGEAVAAAVVLADAATLDVAGLRTLVGRELGISAVPRRVQRVERLPRNANGKVDKRRLRNDQP